MNKNGSAHLPGHDGHRNQTWLNNLPSVLSRLVLLLPLVKWFMSMLSKPGQQSKYSHLNPTDLLHRR